MIRLFCRTIIFLSLLLSLAALNAGAESADTAGKIIQKAGVHPQLKKLLPLNLEFKDEYGHTVKLEDYFGQRPVFLVPVYYRCPMLCGLVLHGLTESLKKINFKPGEEFKIITFSIDPLENPESALQKKENLLKDDWNTQARQGWHFLTSPGNNERIKRLTDSIGFDYVYDRQTGQYAHPAMIILTTAEGRIARYFTGVQFNPRDLRLGIIEASQDRIANLRDQILLLCYHYDPATGKYGFLIQRTLQGICILTFLILAFFIGLSLRHDRSGG